MRARILWASVEQLRSRICWGQVEALMSNATRFDEFTQQHIDCVQQLCLLIKSGGEIQV